MDTLALIQLVQTSWLLSDAEREYWLQSLSAMTPPQCKKLWAILSGTDEMPFQKEVEEYFGALAQAASAALNTRIA